MSTPTMWRLGAWLPDGVRPRADGVAESELRQREAALGLDRGAPFLLAPDGAPDVDVLAYFASSTFKLLSAQTRESYAKDLRLYLSFLSAIGVGWREASWSVVLDYEHWRRRDAANPRPVSGTKISRELAACRKFYDWQYRSGNVPSNPFSGLDGGGTLRVKDARSQRVRWLTSAAYAQWRDVGLAGRRVDGSCDPSWRGRNEDRNVAFANLLWGSGLRLREAATLLTFELPDLDPGARYLRARLGQGVAKGRGRDFWMSEHSRRVLSAYMISTRASAVARAQRAGRYDSVLEPLIVQNRSGRGLLVEERSTGARRNLSLDSLTSSDRARLFVPTPRGLEPAMLFLGDSGLPMRFSSWEATFAAANRRCERQGVPLSCHPHMLRHSFALRMLVTLMHAFDRRMGLSAEERQEYRVLFGDPWVLVQTLLGHANPQITRDVYLEPVRGLHVDLFLNHEDVQDEVAFTATVTRHLAATGLVADAVVPR